jgi:hypothetical protein
VVNIQKLKVIIQKHAARYHKHEKLISVTMGSEMQVALTRKAGLNLILLILVMKLYFDSCQHAVVNICSYFLKT